MKKYKLINYDVWGNNKDGYQVNDAHYTGITIELADDFTDKQLKRALWDCGYCNRGILTASISIDGEPDYSLYINLTGTRYGGFKPFCELRTEEDV